MNQKASLEDFELDKEYRPLVGKTLEEVVADGESDWEKEQAQERISVNNMPLTCPHKGYHLLS